MSPELPSVFIAESPSCRLCEVNVRRWSSSNSKDALTKEQWA